MLNDWVESQGLPRGIQSFDFADPATGQQQAVFDLAWPQGLQQELTEPVVVLLNEGAETIALASRAGFRCFTTSQDFRNYVQKKILEGENAPAAAFAQRLLPVALARPVSKLRRRAFCCSMHHRQNRSPT